MPANRYGDLAIQTGGPPSVLGPAGFWLDASGNVAATDPSGAPQVTPGQQANPQGAIYYDQAKDLYYNLVNGEKLYQSPAAYKGQQQGTGHGMTNPGGSVFETGGTWNPRSAKYEQSFNYGNALSLGIAGALAAPAVAGLVGGAAETYPALSASTVYGPEAPAALTAAETGAAAGGAGAAADVGADVGAATTSASTAAPAAAETLPALPPETVYGPTAPLAQQTASAPSWLTPGVISSGISAGAGLIGAGIQAGATKDAAALEKQYLDEALAYSASQDKYRLATEANRYSNLAKASAPYVQTGQEATARMASLLGLPAPAPAQAPTAPPTYPTPALPSLPQTGTAMPRGPQALAGSSTPTSNLVTMAAPNGTTKQVPPEHVAFYQSRGAQVVA